MTTHCVCKRYFLGTQQVLGEVWLWPLLMLALSLPNLVLWVSGVSRLDDLLTLSR